MHGRSQFGSWMLDNWARMTLPLAVLLLCSLPIFLSAENTSLILLYTLLPVYMIHQYEEHAHGRFVAFVNSEVGKGHEVLTKRFAFWINILDVWLVFLVSFYLAKYAGIGFALVPIYLTILNGITHVIAGVILRRYNPGLYTSLVLFFPWGLFLLVYFNGIIQADVLFNGIGVLAGIAGHAVIVIPVLRRRNRLEASTRGGFPSNP
jgi:hypothetical protein